MINFEMTDDRKIKLISTKDIKESIKNFFSRCFKGDIDDVTPLIKKKIETKDALSLLLNNFITEMNKSSYNHKKFVFKVTKLDDNFHFEITEKNNSITLTANERE